MHRFLSPWLHRPLRLSPGDVAIRKFRRFRGGITRALGFVCLYWKTRGSLIIEFQVHPVVNFVVLQLNVVLEDRVPLFQDDFVGPSSGLSRDHLLQISDGVIRVAFYPNLFPEPIVTSYFDHFAGAAVQFAEEETTYKTNAEFLLAAVSLVSSKVCNEVCLSVHVRV